MAEKGHWYTDKNGNHYFVKEGETPKEGWEASKRRKMIDGGEYKVDDGDGKGPRSVSKDEYDKYQADGADFDATTDDDFGFDEEESGLEVPRTGVEFARLVNGMGADDVDISDEDAVRGYLTEVGYDDGAAAQIVKIMSDQGYFDEDDEYDPSEEEIERVKLAQEGWEDSIPKDPKLRGRWTDEVITDKNKWSFLHENAFVNNFYWDGSDLVDSKTGEAVAHLTGAGIHSTDLYDKMYKKSGDRKNKTEDSERKPGMKNVSYETIKDKLSALEEGLPQDKWAKETRQSYIDSILQSSTRSLKPVADENGKLDKDPDRRFYSYDEKDASDTIYGDLSSWYSSATKREIDAPMEWRRKVSDLINEEFKKAYPSEQVQTKKPRSASSRLPDNVITERPTDNNKEKPRYSDTKLKPEFPGDKEKEPHFVGGDGNRYDSSTDETNSLREDAEERKKNNQEIEGWFSLSQKPSEAELQWLIDQYELSEEETRRLFKKHGLSENKIKYLRFRR